MSVTGNIIGMPPGAGGSFPMAGTRPKIRKTLMVVSSSMAWTAPPNVYHVILQMVGGGGSGGIVSPDNASNFGNTSDPTNTVIGAGALPNSTVPGGDLISTGGGAGVAIAPSIIPVNPGSTYILTGGAGGASVFSRTGSFVGQVTVAGMSGSASFFRGDTVNIIAPGGRGGMRGVAVQPQVEIPVSSSTISALGAQYVLGAVSFATGSLIRTTSVPSANRIASSSGNAFGWGSRDQLDKACESNLGGNTAEIYVGLSGLAPAGYVLIHGGAASLYGTGSDGITTGSVTASVAGFGAGGGAALGYTSATYGNVSGPFMNLTINQTNFPTIGTSSAGGHGFVRIIWEE